MDNNLAIIVLAAGQGTRMKSATPKILHPLAGAPIIAHVLATARASAASVRACASSTGVARSVARRAASPSVSRCDGAI